MFFSPLLFFFLLILFDRERICYQPPLLPTSWFIHTSFKLRLQVQLILIRNDFCEHVSSVSSITVGIRSDKHEPCALKLSSRVLKILGSISPVQSFVWPSNAPMGWNISSQSSVLRRRTRQQLFGQPNYSTFCVPVSYHGTKLADDWLLYPFHCVMTPLCTHQLNVLLFHSQDCGRNRKPFE